MFGGQQEFRRAIAPGRARRSSSCRICLRCTSRRGSTNRIAGGCRPQQEATVRIEAIPGEDFKAKLDSISVLARVDFSSGWPPSKNFDLNLVFVDMRRADAPGMTAVARIATERVPDVVLVPAESIFQRDGAPVVYDLMVRRSWRRRSRSESAAVSRRLSTRGSRPGIALRPAGPPPG